ncbi:MAG: glycosyltransferase family 4 protein [Nitrospirota bacterium]|nr:glycosyltransferase family 4 protein [Nitrospirota bacterium]
MLAIDGLGHGGAERVIASLCNHLDKSRFSITVCWRSARSAIGEELMAQGHEVIGLPELAPAVTPYRRFLVLKKLMQEKQIDILHTHDTGALADGAQCRMFGSKTRLVHTFHFGNYPILRKRYVLMEMVFSRMANHLVAVGIEQAKQIRKALRLSSSRLDTIYNGVGLPTFDSSADPIKPYRIRPGHPVVIGSISTLTEQKGLTFLLEAADILRRRKTNCIFLIVGDGPLRRELESKCKRLSLTDTVHFLGWVPNAGSNLLPFLDIFCQSSLWEANSIVLLEAMAAGLPIVTTDVGESKHVIEEGRSGRIVRSRDPAGMADALAVLVDQQELRQQVGRSAKQDFVDNFIVDKMIARYQEVYNSLM